MQTMSRVGLSALAVSLVIAVLSVSGCGDKKDGEAKVASQVAVKVNGDEISVQQLDFALSKLSNLNPDQAKQAKNQVLKSLVDQQLMVQKAITDKLDSDPLVMQALEASRRQILAQAMIKKISANHVKPSEAELADYYAKNPALFAERRIYRLQEINVQVTQENAERVKAELQKAKNLGDFIAWLKAENIPARAGQSTKTAEQLPLEILPRLHAMKDGQAMTFAAPGALNILVVAGSQTQPLTQEQAKPMIERYLDNAKIREIVEAELKKMKEAAKIEYLGEYADAGKQADAKAEPIAEPAAPSTLAEPTAAEAK